MDVFDFFFVYVLRCQHPSKKSLEHGLSQSLEHSRSISLIESKSIFENLKIFLDQRLSSFFLTALACAASHRGRFNQILEENLAP